MLVFKYKVDYYAVSLYFFKFPCSQIQNQMKVVFIMTNHKFVALI